MCCLRASPFLAFTLASGARIEGTPEHVVIVAGRDGGAWRIDLAARVRVGDRMLTGGAADPVVAVDRVHGDVRYTVASASGTVEVLGAGGDGATVLVGAMCTGEAFEPKPYPAALRDWQRRHNRGV
uniref:Altered inheritance of mitochondria protein 24, mitochondrial n=1 Tax=Neobodo designis TaxID=312471 RepID=A0A7S1LDV7_NEODS|mmetsp:Transcript_20019/g.62166  ORF Transcript_20019/g.62166 Transcript_20019/m.62166 type:complete len:126 (+) Transcript_20019:583-960(+)